MTLLAERQERHTSCENLAAAVIFTRSEPLYLCGIHKVYYGDTLKEKERYIVCDVVVDLEDAWSVLEELRQLTGDACDMLECRIEAMLEKMASVVLCVLPAEEPVTVDEFVAAAETSCTQAAATLTKYSGPIYELRTNNLRFNLARKNLAYYGETLIICLLLSRRR